MRQNVIITPIYEDVDAATQLFADLSETVGKDIFIIAVDDGSIRQPVDPDIIAQSGLEGVVLRLRRNVGHQRAIATGISYAAAEFPDANCIIMDSDGEDRPESVVTLLETISGVEEDVIVASRKSRVETFRFKLFYVFYKFIFSILTGRKIAFGNFMALKPNAVRRLATMQELWVHVAASILVSRLRVVDIPFDRGARYQGQSKMNFGGLVLHGFRALMVFAEDVLVRVGIICVLVASLTILAMFMTVILKLLSFATPGWFSIALAVLFIMFLQTGALTLMTLMLTGVMRGSSVLVDDYRQLIDKVLKTSG